MCSILMLQKLYICDEWKLSSSLMDLFVSEILYGKALPKRIKMRCGGGILL